MRPITKTLSATGYTEWIPVDYTLSAFNVGIQVLPTVGASVIWSVQTTLEDPFTNLIPRPIQADGILKTGIDYAQGNITTPCRAVRLAATIVSGSVDFTVVQGRR